MRFITTAMASIAIAFSIHTMALAGSVSKIEAVELVNKTVAHATKVGIARAAVDVNTLPDWKTKGMNTVIFNFDGLNLASAINPRLVGKQMLESKDPTGKEFIREYIATAKSPSGEGWVDFQFMNPESNQVENRTMYIRRIPGQEALVGVAYSK